MSDPRNASDLPRNTETERQSETTSLKRNEPKKRWFMRVFGSNVGDQEQSSLQTIIVNFFAFTVIITVALLVQTYYGIFEVEPHGSVASDSYECSMIGVNILKKGGNAVDGAIATVMCLGVVNFHITGLGGGGYMMIYNHRKHEVLDIKDFQATVPNALLHKETDNSIEGLTVGVPGLLMGLWEAHQKFGKLSWEELITPALQIAKYGFKISKNVISAFSHLNLKSSRNLNLVQFANSLIEGKNVTLPDLATTLQLIASTGPYEFYNGSLAKDIVHSVKQANGSMTLNDMSQYETSRSELLHAKLGKYSVLASGSSSGGPLLLNALDNIQFLDLTAEDETPSIILKMSDILHYSYTSFLEKNNADPKELEPIASQVSVIDGDDVYVVIVSGLNTWLGSQILTGSGFILNNAVANGGVNNEKRPLSFSTPAIVIESDEVCGRRLILGSGDAISAAQVLTYALIFNQSVSSSVESPRFFVDSIPRHIMVEDLHKPFYDPMVVKNLQLKMKVDRILPPYKSINVIEKIDDIVTAHSDSRGGGLAFKFK